MFQVSNGINLFYEQTGSGAPLILAHGNGEDHTIFDRLVPRLAEFFTVYAVDSPGHGRSQRPKEFHYTDFAAVFSAFIRELKLERPAFCGFSDGAIIGILLAAGEPSLLSRLVLCGANLTPRGLKRRWLTLFKAEAFFTQNPKLKMMLHEPQITSEILRKITVPTLITAGAHDMIQKSDTQTIAECISGAKLHILPGEGHASYVAHTAKLAPLLLEFFEVKQEP